MEMMHILPQSTLPATQPVLERTYFLSGMLDAKQLEPFIAMAPSVRSNLLLDMSQVRELDTRVVGPLLKLIKAYWKQGLSVRFTAVGPEMLTFLEVVQLDRLFLTTPEHLQTYPRSA